MNALFLHYKDKTIVLNKDMIVAVEGDLETNQIFVYFNGIKTHVIPTKDTEDLESKLDMIVAGHDISL